MKRTSVRTLLLLVELLVAVAIWQFIAWTPSAGAAVMWLDDDPNEVLDPNEAQPESIGSCARIALDEDPNEVVDPNEAQPESIGSCSRVALDEEPVDPNTPDEETEPLPEAACVPAVWRL